MTSCEDNKILRVLVYSSWSKRDNGSGEGIKPEKVIDNRNQLENL